MVWNGGPNYLLGSTEHGSLRPSRIEPDEKLRSQSKPAEQNRSSSATLAAPWKDQCNKRYALRARRREYRKSRQDNYSRISSVKRFFSFFPTAPRSIRMASIVWPCCPITLSRYLQDARAIQEGSPVRLLPLSPERVPGDLQVLLQSVPPDPSRCVSPQLVEFCGKILGTGAVSDFSLLRKS
jgi:hypothetical protein